MAAGWTEIISDCSSNMRPQQPSPSSLGLLYCLRVEGVTLTVLINRRRKDSDLREICQRSDNVPGHGLDTSTVSTECQ